MAALHVTRTERRVHGPRLGSHVPAHPRPLHRYVSRRTLTRFVLHCLPRRLHGLRIHVPRCEAPRRHTRRRIRSLPNYQHRHARTCPHSPSDVRKLRRHHLLFNPQHRKTPVCTPSFIPNYPRRLPVFLGTTASSCTTTHTHSVARSS